MRTTTLLVCLLSLISLAGPITTEASAPGGAPPEPNLLIGGEPRAVPAPGASSRITGDRPAQAGSRTKLSDASLFLPGVHLTELDGLAVTRWSEGNETEPDPVPSAAIRAGETSGGSRVDLTRSCTAGSVFLVESSELFGVSKRIGDHGCARPIRIVLSPRSTLEGRFLPPQGDELPRRARSSCDPAAAPPRRPQKAIVAASRP